MKHCYMQPGLFKKEPGCSSCPSYSACRSASIKLREYNIRRCSTIDREDYPNHRRASRELQTSLLRTKAKRDLKALDGEI